MNIRTHIQREESIMQATTERKTILSYERMRSSVNGNPRYRIVFTDGTIAPMMSDSGSSYAIGNPDMCEGCAVDVEFTRSGNIRWMRATS